MRGVLALLPVLIAFQAGAPPALAWTWPADGPVLRLFALGDDPYAGGQHRGVDVAGPTGAPVRSPASGVVTFAGTVPGGGRALTVRTSDGYSVTLVHLGKILVERGALVAEGEPVGAIGPTGDAEHLEPYVHLGVRVASDPHGYLDPLVLLPSRETVPVPPSPAPPADPVPTVPPDAELPTPAPVAEPAPPSEAPVSAPGTVRGPAAVPGVSGLPPAAAQAPPGEAQVSTGAARTVTPPVTVSPGIPAVAARRLQLRSFQIRSEPYGPAEPAGEVAGSEASSAPAEVRIPAALGGGAAFVAVASLAAALLLRRRQLGEAWPADASAHVLDERAGGAAEDTSTSRSVQEDGLVVDRDLERIALGEPESLPDLDRDDDPAELVQVPDDSCRRLRTSTVSGRFHQIRPRVPSRCGRVETLSTR
jgi:Peptidase family M23